MTPDVAQMNLNEPDVNHDEYVSGSGFQAPPPVKRADGSIITYWGKVTDELEFTGTNRDNDSEGNSYLLANFGPVFIERADGGLPDGAEGYEIRYASASAKPFTRKKGPNKGQPMNASMLGNYLRAHGIKLSGVPQNADYIRAAEGTAGRVFPFTLEWETYDGETRETLLKGYDNYPLNGDSSRNPTITTKDGRNLTARARIRGFIDQTGS